jgi:hypothetical protein
MSVDWGAFWGEALRDAGMHATQDAAPGWHAAYQQLALEALPLLPREIIGEDLRELLQEQFALPDPPKSPNSWGAAWNGLCRAGYLTGTDRLRPMRKPRSHARRSPVFINHLSKENPW